MKNQESAEKRQNTGQLMIKQANDTEVSGGQVPVESIEEKKEPDKLKDDMGA